MQGGQRRAYGDFRDYSDVGGRQEALIPPSEARATTDSDVASELVARRVRVLEGRRRNRTLLGHDREATLGAFAAHHLVQKARSGLFTEQWLASVEMHLRAAVDFLGDERDLKSIGVEHVEGFACDLAARGNRRGGTLSGSSVRKYLNSLSNLYRRAQAERYVMPGYNPVAAMMDKPRETRREAHWLEVDEAAALLDAARRHQPDTARDALPFAHAIVGVFLLTGGRKSEVLGLQVSDISFDRKTVAFRPNKWRRLKTRTSHRVVPLWPQLEDILRAHVFGAEGPRGELLFPSPRTGRMIHDLRKLLDRLAQQSELELGAVRTRALRHTYCAARLQTTDRGAPVAQYTVAKEMGHGGTRLVDRIYGHLGEVRHRAEVVEYRGAGDPYETRAGVPTQLERS